MTDHDRPSKLIGLGTAPAGEGGYQFNVWAPRIDRVEVRMIAPQRRIFRLEKREQGYHTAVIDGIAAGDCYVYRLAPGVERPDPASRFQPRGVHGPSQIIDAGAFSWDEDDWRGLRLEDYVIYELHVGTYTPEGTFEAIIPYLEEIRSLGVTALEIMPVAQFPGDRNWGYDGAYPFAVQNTYGGPTGLQRLVNACHRRGLAVVLDVVYNHLGPEGNYLEDFAPYFTDRYRTPWGAAINFDGPGSDEVRRYFMENALYWIKEFRIDSLRLDAIHGIFDFSAHPFLSELSEAVHAFARSSGRNINLIAESDLNNVRVLRGPEAGGYGLDAQWNDDFHHSLHVLLTGERAGYYQDFGRVEHLAKALTEGFVYSGQYSQFRKRRHGSSSREVGAGRFVVCNQNHDQTGNRMLGDRLATRVSFESLKLAAGAVILSPFIPLLFMGEEYGETAPFQYFISHSDQELIKAIQKRRREEFASRGWPNEAPDPQDESTFFASKLNPSLRLVEPHRTLQEFYRELIRLRSQHAPLSHLSKESCEVTTFEAEKVLGLRRWKGRAEAQLIFNFNAGDTTAVTLPLPRGIWQKALDSSEERWRGPGSLLPAAFDSEGQIRLRLPPTTFVVLFHNSIQESA
ncbi:MAG: malto-oligosyltrehalose trehalohydrolase [Terriglobia bacterium]